MVDRYAVITARDEGDRFRPLSSPEKPAPFLRLFGERSMLQLALERVRSLVSLRNTLVVASSRHVGLVHRQLPQLPAENVIPEPVDRGTAASAGLSAIVVYARDPDATTLVLSTDHLIAHPEAFERRLGDTIETVASSRQLVALGILTDRRAEHDRGIGRAARQGTSFRSCGTFVWRVDTILEELRDHLPSLYASLSELAPQIGRSAFHSSLVRAYSGLAGRSLERDVLEKSGRLLTIPAPDIGWRKIDGWRALRAALAHVEKPWGGEHLWALGPSYAGKLLHIRAGESLSLQYHRVKDETIHLLEGRLLLRIGENEARLEERVLVPGESCDIPSGTVHQMEASEECVIVEVSTPHLDDVVRLRDRYGRHGAPVENG